VYNILNKIDIENINMPISSTNWYRTVFHSAKMSFFKPSMASYWQSGPYVCRFWNKLRHWLTNANFWYQYPNCMPPHWRCYRGNSLTPIRLRKLKYLT